MKRTAAFSILAATLLLAACTTAPSERLEIRQITSTTSFGMCVGYCTTRLEVTEAGAVLIREARGGRGASDLPDQRFSAPLTQPEWQELSDLAARTDLSRLPTVIGCPDCADGGAETLAITDATLTRTITFEYNASIGQAEPLLQRLRALRARLAPPAG